MDSNIFIPLLLLFPLSIGIFLTYEKTNLKNKKLLSIMIILLLVWIPNGMFIPVSAETNVKQIIKIEDIYDTDNSFEDYVIHPPLTNVSKSVAYVSFSHTGEDDHSDTFRSWKIIDNSTLRIFGEDTASGNNLLEFIAFVVEYKGTVEIQHLERITTASESEGEKTETIPNSINTTNSFLVHQGHAHNATETSVGIEEFDRVRIITSTTWGWLVGDTPNSGDQSNPVSIIDLNDDDFRIQRGLATLSDGSSTISISPPTDIVRDRSILLVSYTCTTGCGFSQPVDDSNIRATIDTSSPPDIVITRGGTSDDLEIAWEIIEDVGETKLKVSHQELTETGTTGTFSVPEVRDFDKSIAISTVSSPFGYSGASTGDTTAGAIDRAMFDIQLVNEDQVFIERGDGTDTGIVGVQVIEFLEEEFAENTSQQNFLKQVVKIDDTFTAGNVIQDYTISPALTNINKTLVFMSMNSTFQDGSSENGKMWEIVDENTFRIIGSGTATNDGADFHAQLVEFNVTSPIFIQMDQLQYPEDLSDSTRSMWISPVNTSNSFIIGQGSVMEDGDPTFGQEEFAMITLENGTRWQYETEIAQDEVETVYRAMITDWNQDDIFVQRGTEIINSTTTEIVVSPPTAIERSESLLFVNFRTVDGGFGEFPNRTALSATLNDDNDIIIQRNASGIEIEIAWQTITAPEVNWEIQHGIHNQQQGQFNETEKIDPPLNNITNAFAIGTVASYYSLSMGNGNSTEANGFDTVYGKMVLENGTSLRFTRGDSSGNWNIGYQIVDWFFGEGGTITVVDADDNATVTDIKILNITKNQTDVSSAVDVSINFDIFKALGDVVIVNDTTVLNVTTDFIQNATDVIITEDSVILNITKVMDDMTANNETVSTTKIIDLLINASDNTVEALDNVILFVNTTIPPTPPPTGGGGTPIPNIPLSPVRLIGLDVESELIQVTPSESVSSDFLISWFGLSRDNVRVTNIQTADEFSDFNSWFVYQTPELLDISTTEGFDNRFPTDPRSTLNKALNGFKVVAPRNACTGDLQNEFTSICLNPILYELPLEFEFDVKGAKFKHVHTVQIDARIQQEECGFFIGALQCFIEDNYIVLIALGLLFIIIVGFVKARRRKVTHVHIIRSRDIDQLGEGKTSRKFKKLRKKK